MRIIARLVATSPAGVGLQLIGGFRYRLLDGSQRFSADIDYHWEGDLVAKQQELLALCRRVILRQVGLQTGYQGSASARTGPDADAPNARFIDLRFWKRDNQIEIPIEITRIVCQKVIDEQMDPVVAQQINLGGGGGAVLESALSLILRVCPP